MVLAVCALGPHQRGVGGAASARSCRFGASLSSADGRSSGFSLRASGCRPQGPVVPPSQPPGDLRRVVPCPRAQLLDQAIQGSSSRLPACLRPNRRPSMQGSTTGWPLSDRRRGVRRGLRPSHRQSRQGVHRGATGRGAACATELGKGSQFQPRAGSGLRLHVLPREM